MGAPNSLMHPAKPLFSYRPYWAARFGPAPFLSLSRREMIPPMRSSSERRSATVDTRLPGDRR